MRLSKCQTHTTPRNPTGCLSLSCVCPYPYGLTYRESLQVLIDGRSGISRLQVETLQGATSDSVTVVCVHTTHARQRLRLTGCKRTYHAMQASVGYVYPMGYGRIGCTTPPPFGSMIRVPLLTLLYLGLNSGHLALSSDRLAYNENHSHYIATKRGTPRTSS